MKKLPKRLSLRRETLQNLVQAPTLKDVAAGYCSRVGTSCGSCVKACTFTCSIVICG
ncbi:MAG TPA: hypothetical protein VOA80_06740 [Thermoanaerobaculia bacterium]|nr:hypothetical protein [Thermoanaerobaculia bacterium]